MYLKKYRVILFFVLPFLLLTLTTTTGCDPYRRGATVKPMGGSGGKKYHSGTATSKARKKRKY